MQGWLDLILQKSLSSVLLPFSWYLLFGFCGFKANKYWKALGEAFFAFKHET